MAQTLARSAQRGAPRSWRAARQGFGGFWKARGAARVDTWLSAPIQAQIPQLAWYTDTP